MLTLIIQLVGNVDMYTIDLISRIYKANVDWIIGKKQYFFIAIIDI